MEKHGKRQDQMGPTRVVRDVPPLVYGSLDLADARAQHMADVQQQQGQTAALHIICQYPTDLPGAETEETQQQMLAHAVRFANAYHGGGAVFAARLDRDEAGRHTVDVFAMPKTDFTYKSGKTVRRAVVSKYAKAHARERAPELIDHDDPKEVALDPEGSIMQGRAMQAAWYEYLQDEMGLIWVQPPDRKRVRSKDRLEPEEYKIQLRREEVEAEAIMTGAGARQQAKKIIHEAKVEAALTGLGARSKAREVVGGATQQVAEGLREMETRKVAMEREMDAKKAALEAWERELKAKEGQVLRDAHTVSAARRMVGIEQDPEVETIRTRSKVRGQDQR